MTRQEAQQEANRLWDREGQKGTVMEKGGKVWVGYRYDAGAGAARWRTEWLGNGETFEEAFANIN